MLTTVVLLPERAIPVFTLANYRVGALTEEGSDQKSSRRDGNYRASKFRQAQQAH